MPSCSQLVFGLFFGLIHGPMGTDRSWGCIFVAFGMLVSAKWLAHFSHKAFRLLRCRWLKAETTPLIVSPNLPIQETSAAKTMHRMTFGQALNNSANSIYAFGLGTAECLVGYRYSILGGLILMASLGIAGGAIIVHSDTSVKFDATTCCEGRSMPIGKRVGGASR
jgi:hypothetical protein